MSVCRVCGHLTDLLEFTLLCGLCLTDTACNRCIADRHCCHRYVCLTCGSWDVARRIFEWCTVTGHDNVSCAAFVQCRTCQSFKTAKVRTAVPKLADLALDSVDAATCATTHWPMPLVDALHRRQAKTKVHVP